MLIWTQKKFHDWCGAVCMYVSVDVADRSDKWQRPSHWLVTVWPNFNVGRQNDSVPREARANFSVVNCARLTRPLPLQILPTLKTYLNIQIMSPTLSFNKHFFFFYFVINNIKLHNPLNLSVLIHLHFNSKYLFTFFNNYFFLI